MPSRLLSVFVGFTLILASQAPIKSPGGGGGGGPVPILPKISLSH